MPIYRSTRATVPRNFFTSRRTTRRPYRSYTYTRSRPSSTARNYNSRIPIPAETELWWLRNDNDDGERSVFPRAPGTPSVPDRPSVPSVPEVPSVPVIPSVPEVPTLPAVTEKELATKLHVKSVDLHIETNTAAHHTDMYDCTEDREYEGEKREAELVVRRGQTLLMTVTFDRPYDIKKNDITFVFVMGDDFGGDFAILEEEVKLDETASSVRDKSKWGATIQEKKDTTLTVAVHIPASAAVGEWKLMVRTIVDVVENEDIVWEYEHNKEIAVLFNPWCKDDLVYMENEEWLKETVLSDSGAIYYGSHRSPAGRKWVFGQFEEDILDVSIFLVRRVFGYDATPALGNVIRVVRALSKMVNANDEAGVLVGNWSGDYEDGTSPTEWGGSIKILRKYMKTELPVQYGQCWVFSGVLTTVCRALGIPCRSVTNFESAHNSDNKHLSCDVINEKGFDGNWHEQKIDSIWNFHVWNEVWLKRHDLSSGDGLNYDGWQVIDATPQERSDGVYQCGPSPLTAIKEGNLAIGSDTAFVFAEVNGDKVEWRRDPKTGVLLQIERVKNAIGKKISTHEPTGLPYEGKLSYERLDITDQYKYPEGTEKEREIVRKAERMFRWDNYEETGVLPQVEAIDIWVVDKDYAFGSPMKFEVKMRNTGELPRTISLSLEVQYNNYRGVTTGTAMSKKIPEFKLDVAQENVSTIEIDELTSIAKPRDGFNFKLVAIAEAKESGHISKHSSKVRLLKPDIKVEGPSTCKRGDEFDVTLTFTNPLSVPMEYCVLFIEGTLKPVLPATDKMEISEIKAKETWKKTIRMKAAMKPRFRKIRDAAFDLSCKGMGTFSGLLNVNLE